MAAVVKGKGKAKRGTWRPEHHPRDARGRFTRSSTRVMAPADLKRAQAGMAGFKPAELGDGAARADWLQRASAATPSVEGGAIGPYLDGGWRDDNPKFRAGKPVEGVDQLDAAFTASEEDVMLRRVVPAAMFAHIPIDQLVGMKMRDAAPSSMSLDHEGPGAPGAVTMHIAAPAGTRMYVNDDAGEVLTIRDTEVAVTRAVPRDDGSGWDLYGAVIPRTDAPARADKPAAGDAGAPNAPTAGTDTPAAGDETAAGGVGTGSGGTGDGGEVTTTAVPAAADTGTTPPASADDPLILWKDAETGRPVYSPGQPEIVRKQVVRDPEREDRVRRGMAIAAAAMAGEPEATAIAGQRPAGDLNPDAPAAPDAPTAGTGTPDAGAPDANAPEAPAYSGRRRAAGAAEPTAKPADAKPAKKAAAAEPAAKPQTPAEPDSAHKPSDLAEAGELPRGATDFAGVLAGGLVEDPAEQEKVRAYLHSRIGDFPDEKSGITAVAGSVKHTRGLIHIRYALNNADGEKIGSVKRTLGTNQITGEPYVTNQYMDIEDKTMRGGGFAGRFNARNEQFWHANGIDTMRLTADTDVGGYAWARSGYDFEHVHGAGDLGVQLDALMRGDQTGGYDVAEGSVAEKFSAANWDDATRAAAADLVARSKAATDRYDELTRGGDETKANAEAIELAPTPLEFAMLGWTPDSGSGKAAMWPGKGFMLGRQWNGQKRLDVTPDGKTDRADVPAAPDVPAVDVPAVDVPAAATPDAPADKGRAPAAPDAPTAGTAVPDAAAAPEAPAAGGPRIPGPDGQKPNPRDDPAGWAAASTDAELADTTTKRGVLPRVKKAIAEEQRLRTMSPEEFAAEQRLNASVSNPTRGKWDEHKLASGDRVIFFGDKVKTKDRGELATLTLSAGRNPHILVRGEGDDSSLLLRLDAKSDRFWIAPVDAPAAGNGDQADAGAPSAPGAPPAPATPAVPETPAAPATPAEPGTDRALGDLAVANIQTHSPEDFAALDAGGEIERGDLVVVKSFNRYRTAVVLSVSSNGRVEAVVATPSSPDRVYGARGKAGTEVKLLRKGEPVAPVVADDNQGTPLAQLDGNPGVPTAGTGTPGEQAGTGPAAPAADVTPATTAAAAAAPAEPAAAAAPEVRPARVKMDDEQYRKDYERGWRTSKTAGSDSLERGDARNEPDAWYDGWSDYSVDQPKWSTPRKDDAEERARVAGEPLYALVSYNAAGQPNGFEIVRGRERLEMEWAADHIEPAQRQLDADGRGSASRGRVGHTEWGPVADDQAHLLGNGPMPAGRGVPPFLPRGAGDGNQNAPAAGTSAPNAPAAPAGPAPIPAGVMNDTPLTPNNWGGASSGPVHFHPDGDIGRAVDMLGADARLDVDGLPLAEQLNRLATEGARVEITVQDQVDRLRVLAARLPDGPGKRAVTMAADDMDAPAAPVPDVPEGTPEPLARLMGELWAVPMVRRDGEQAGEITGLNKVIARAARGGSNKRLADVLRSEVLNKRHESKEGKTEIDTAVRRAMNDLERTPAAPAAPSAPAAAVPDAGNPFDAMTTPQPKTVSRAVTGDGTRPGATEVDMFGNVTSFTPASRSAIGLGDRPQVGRDRQIAAAQQLGLMDETEASGGGLGGGETPLFGLFDMPQADPPPAATPAPADANPQDTAAARVIAEDLSGWTDEQLAGAFADVTGGADLSADHETAMQRIDDEWAAREQAMTEAAAAVPEDLTTLGEDDLVALMMDLTSRHGTIDDAAVARVDAEIDARMVAAKAEEETAALRAVADADTSTFTDHDQFDAAQRAATSLGDFDAVERIFNEWTAFEDAENARDEADRVEAQRVEAQRLEQVRIDTEAAAQREVAAAAETERVRTTNAMIAARAAAVIPPTDDATVRSAHQALGDDGVRAAIGAEKFDRIADAVGKSPLQGDDARMYAMRAQLVRLPEEDRARIALAAAEIDTPPDVRAMGDTELMMATLIGGVPNGAETAEQTAEREAHLRAVNAEQNRRGMIALRAEGLEEFARFRERIRTQPVGELTDAELAGAPGVLASDPDSDLLAKLGEIRAEADRRQGAAADRAARKAAGPQAPAKLANPIGELGTLERMTDGYRDTPYGREAGGRLLEARALAVGLPATATDAEVRKAEREDQRSAYERAAWTVAWYRHLGEFADIDEAYRGVYWVGGPADEADAPDVPLPLPGAKVAKPVDVWEAMKQQAVYDRRAGIETGAQRYTMAMARSYGIPFDPADRSDDAMRKLGSANQDAQRGDTRTMAQRTASYIAEWRRLAAEDGVDPDNHLLYGPPDKRPKNLPRTQWAPTADEEIRVNRKVAGGADWDEAFAEVMGINPDDLRREQAASATTGTARPTDKIIKQHYAEHVTRQYMDAEAATNGYLLNKTGTAKGIEPESLFSGDPDRAYRFASEELMRWWGDNPRLTYGDYKAQLVGEGRAAQQRAAQGAKGNEFA